MHGVGAKWIEMAFKSFNLPLYVPVKSQLLPDPDFPTVSFPNPEEGKGALVSVLFCCCPPLPAQTLNIEQVSWLVIATF